MASRDPEGRALRTPEPGSVRLAWGGPPLAIVKSLEAPTVRLAHSTPGSQGNNVLEGKRGVEPLPAELAPALLVSFAYLDAFLRDQARYVYRDWVMDSGAFSAYNSGVTIDMGRYIDTCLELAERDPTLVEVFALDVIDDWEGSARNTEEMWRQGVKAIPCYHTGEPWAALVDMAKKYPKIAIGGAVGMVEKAKMKWVGQCFARIWPKAIHGFGMSGERMVLTFPFHSVDATNWEMGPCGFGRWKSYGGQHVSVRGSEQNLRVEVEWHLELERKARWKWKKQMADLAPTLRLAYSTGGAGKVAAKALGPRKEESDV